MTIWADHQQDKRNRADAPKIAEQAAEWGVFVWEAANMYRPQDAVHRFKRRSTAERYADRTEGNLVVRSILTRPMHDGEVPEVALLTESSSFGVIEGHVRLVERDSQETAHRREVAAKSTPTGL